MATNPELWSVPEFKVINHLINTITLKIKLWKILLPKQGEKL